MAVKTNYEKNGYKYFRTSLSLGHDHEGKRIIKEFYGASKTEADSKKKEYKEGTDAGLIANFDKIGIGKLMHSWLYDTMRIRADIKPSTFCRYESIYRNYIEQSPIYPMKIANLKSTHIQKYFNELYKNGKTPATIRNVNKIIKMFFNYCIEHDYMVKSPASKLMIPGATKDSKETFLTFSSEEILKVKSAADNRTDMIKMIFFFDLSTGLRMGELLALRWSDINDGKVTVSKTTKSTYAIDEKGTRTLTRYEYAPKTKNSERIIPIPQEVTRMLLNFKAAQREALFAKGVKLSDKHYVFSQTGSEPLDIANVRKSYLRLLARAGVEPRKMHSLRHTYATELFRKGIHLKTVQMLLGHSNIATTADIYTHVGNEEKEAAAKAINHLFLGSI